MQQADIIVIGAGAAGLMAARKLGEAGKKVVILEARDRIGGQIYPLDKEEFGYEAAGGAEFVHGDAPITTALVSEAGLHFEPASERAWWSVIDGPAKQMEWKPREFEDEFIEQLKGLKEDMTVADVFKTYFADEKYATLRDMMTRRLEGLDAADVNRVSAFMLRDEMLNMRASRQRDLNFNEGYGTIVRFLAQRSKDCGAEILLQQEVVAIERTENGVRVTCKNHEQYSAHRVVITVPPPIIKTISFTPEIPEKIRAVDMIGYGGVIKVLVRFKTRWWATKGEKFEVPFFMLSREAIPTWWTQYPEPYLTLTGWVGGPSARRLSVFPDDEIFELALTSLSAIFDISIETLREGIIASKVINWIADPFARGAYSYDTPETPGARAELLKPVDGKLFFAGEAIGKTEISGTVEAAFASGIDVAESVLHTP